MQQDWLGLIPG